MVVRWGQLPSLETTGPDRAGERWRRYKIDQCETWVKIRRWMHGASGSVFDMHSHLHTTYRLLMATNEWGSSIFFYKKLTGT